MKSDKISLIAIVLVSIVLTAVGYVAFQFGEETPLIVDASAYELSRFKSDIAVEIAVKKSEIAKLKLELAELESKKVSNESENIDERIKLASIRIGQEESSLKVMEDHSTFLNKN